MYFVQKIKTVLKTLPSMTKLLGGCFIGVLIISLLISSCIKKTTMQNATQKVSVWQTNAKTFQYLARKIYRKSISSEADIVRKAQTEAMRILAIKNDIDMDSLSKIQQEMHSVRDEYMDLKERYDAACLKAKFFDKDAHLLATELSKQSEVLAKKYHDLKLQLELPLSFIKQREAAQLLINVLNNKIDENIRKRLTCHLPIEEVSDLINVNAKVIVSSQGNTRRSRYKEIITHGDKTQLASLCDGKLKLEFTINNNSDRYISLIGGTLSLCSKDGTTILTEKEFALFSEDDFPLAPNASHLYIPSPQETFLSEDEWDTLSETETYVLTYAITHIYLADEKTTFRDKYDVYTLNVTQ